MRQAPGSGIYLEWEGAGAHFREGWHNNHHRYQSSCRQGFYWWEIDASYYVIRVLAAVGLVWDLKKPSARLLDPASHDGARDGIGQ